MMPSATDKHHAEHPLIGPVATAAHTHRRYFGRRHTRRQEPDHKERTVTGPVTVLVEAAAAIPAAKASAAETSSACATIAGHLCHAAAAQTGSRTLEPGWTDLMLRRDNL